MELAEEEDLSSEEIIWGGTSSRKHIPSMFHALGRESRMGETNMVHRTRLCREMNIFACRDHSTDTVLMFTESVGEVNKN